MSKNTKIILGGVAVLGICGLVVGVTILGMSGLYFVSSVSSSSVEYFLTVNEALSKDDFVNKQIRISGAVIGELSFLIANVPADYEQVEQQGGIAVVLENAVNDPTRQKVEVVYVGEKPELLRNMAQAIVTGELHSDGRFYADEILLKCPSRYEEAVPNQAVD